MKLLKHLDFAGRSSVGLGFMLAGGTVREPLHMIDLFPTALAAAGIPKS